MKGEKSSKWMYMRSTVDIPLKRNDIRSADIDPKFYVIDRYKKV